MESINISLNNGILRFDGLSKDDIRKIYNRFRVDLLDAKVPHYRPIAFMIEGTLGTSTQSNISKIPRLGYSNSELSFILSNLIVSKRRGVMPNVLQATAALTRLRSDPSYINLSGKDIGTSYPGSIFYTGEGINSVPEFLLKDTTVFRKLKESVSINVILLRSTGTRDFYDNQLLLNRTNYKSMRTYYNLYDYFSIKQYLGEDYIQLYYNLELNENVLEEILRDYFNELVENKYI